MRAVLICRLSFFGFFFLKKAHTQSIQGHSLGVYINWRAVFGSLLCELVCCKFAGAVFPQKAVATLSLSYCQCQRNCLMNLHVSMISILGSRSGSRPWPSDHPLTSYRRFENPKQLNLAVEKLTPRSCDCPGAWVSPPHVISNRLSWMSAGGFRVLKICWKTF